MTMTNKTQGVFYTDPNRKTIEIVRDKDAEFNKTHHSSLKEKLKDMKIDNHYFMELSTRYYYVGVYVGKEDDKFVFAPLPNQKTSKFFTKLSLKDIVGIEEIKKR
jgi:hypothetical protein